MSTWCAVGHTSKNVLYIKMQRWTREKKRRLVLEKWVWDLFSCFFLVVVFVKFCTLFYFFFHFYFTGICMLVQAIGCIQNQNLPNAKFESFVFKKAKMKLTNKKLLFRTHKWKMLNMETEKCKEDENIPNIDGIYLIRECIWLEK